MTVGQVLDGVQEPQARGLMMDGGDRLHVAEVSSHFFHGSRFGNYANICSRAFDAESIEMQNLSRCRIYQDAESIRMQNLSG